MKENCDKQFYWTEFFKLFSLAKNDSKISEILGKKIIVFFTYLSEKSEKDQNIQPFLNSLPKINEEY